MHGEDAIYTVVGGRPTLVRVIPSQPDDDVGFGASRVQSDTFTFLVEASAIERPRKGDIVEFDGRQFSVQPGASRDEKRLIWTVSGEPA